MSQSYLQKKQLQVRPSFLNISHPSDENSTDIVKPGGHSPQQSYCSPEELQDSVLQFLQPDWRGLKSYLEMLKKIKQATQMGSQKENVIFMINLKRLFQ